MRFEDLVPAADRPRNAAPAERSVITTHTREVVMSDDLRNAGFVNGLFSKKRQGMLRASRRNFIRGSVVAAGAGVASGMTKFGPARQAEAQSVITSPQGYRIYTGCPSYASWHDCIPGCGAPPTCTNCCTSDGYFREDQAAGYRVSYGVCSYDGGFADGWLWAYGAPCGGCATVELRCSDGLSLEAGQDGALYWFPYICRWVTQCGTVPPDPTPTATPIVVAPTPTPDPTQSYTLIGNFGSVIDNGNGSVSITGWIAAQGAQQTNYSIVMDGQVIAVGFANLPYPTGLSYVGPNHGFTTTLFGVVPGQHEFCLEGTLGNITSRLTCLTLTASAPATPTVRPTNTPVPTPTPDPGSIKDETAIPLAFRGSGVLEVLKTDTGGAFASGWACDRANPGSINVIATVDGAVTTRISTTTRRADVTQYNPQFENARAFTMAIGLASGQTAEVCIFAEQPGTNDRVPLGCSVLTGP